MTLLQAIKIDSEGGKDMRDISELHPNELGEIIWQHNSCATDLYISKRLKVKLWQVKKYIKSIEERIS